MRPSAGRISGLVSWRKGLVSCYLPPGPEETRGKNLHEGKHVGNSKTLGAARKHRRKRRAAKHKVHEFLRGKGGDASKLSILAQKMLQRRLRLTTS